MAVTSLARSSLSSPIKYDSFLAGAHTSVFQLIQSITVGSGGASSVTFSNIPQTFTHLQVRAIGKASSGTSNPDLYVQANGDTASNYSWHSLYGQGSAATSSAGTSSSIMVLGFNWGVAASVASTFSGAVIDVLDYANTSKNKTFRSLAGADVNGSGSIVLNSGNWRSTSAIASLTFTLQPTFSFGQHTSFSLYGLR